MLKKMLVGACVGVIAFAASTTSAWAFYCGVANKPAGAGVWKQPLDEPLVNPGGKAYYPGAFVDAGGVDIFVRGPEHHEDSFGAANDNAIANGPDDHGVVLMFDD